MTYRRTFREWATDAAKAARQYSGGGDCADYWDAAMKEFNSDA